jgi:hypothetical protein
VRPLKVVDLQRRSLGVPAGTGVYILIAYSLRGFSATSSGRRSSSQSSGPHRRGPEDLVVEAAGNVNVTDSDNNRVLKLAIGAASLTTPPFADLDHPPDSSHGPLQTACVGGDVRGGAGLARRGRQ